ncbi:MAG: zinc-ribbon domain-containing protein [Methanosphaera sp.]|nr:zinc-ribbon domain-containing protein [Methanosphaera sp.]
MSTEYNIKFCPNCGTKTIPNAKFCIECGYELASLYKQNSPNNNENDSNKNINNDSNIPSPENHINNLETSQDNQKNEPENSLQNNLEETEQNTIDTIETGKPVYELKITIPHQPENKDNEEVHQEKSNNQNFDIIRPATNNKPKINQNKKNTQPIKKDFNVLKTQNQKPANNNQTQTTPKQEGLPCPSCGNNMQISQKTGLLSGGTYHTCNNCLITFKANNENLVLTDEPEFTRFKSKLHLKRYTHKQWKEILSGNYTTDEVNKITKWKFEGQTNIPCPACSHELNKYKTGGFVTHYLVCKYCNLILEEHKNEKYTLYNSTETHSPLWKHEKNPLSIQELQGLFGHESPDEKKQRQLTVQAHEQLVKKQEKEKQQQKEDMELFAESIMTGKPMLPAPTDTTIVLKNKENPVYKVENVSLLEPRSVRTSSGGYGGTSVRITKGVTLHSGRTASKSESHDEIKLIDTGDLLITNQRIIFLGSNRTTNIDIKKIIAITSEENRIQIQRSNKQKPEYFTNVKSSEQVTINGRTYSVDIDGEMLRKLVLGLI